MPTKITLLVVKPKQTPEIHTVVADIEGLKGFVGGYLEMVPRGVPTIPALLAEHGMHVYCNEDGKAQGLETNFVLQHPHAAITVDHVCGTVVVSALDREGNETSLTADQINVAMGAFARSDRII